MGREDTRLLCVSMIQQHDQCAAGKEERQQLGKVRDASRDKLMEEVVKAGGALRVDDTRVLRVQDVASRRT